MRITPSARLLVALLLLDEGIAPDVAVPLAGWPFDDPAAWPDDPQHARAVARLGEAL